MEQGDSVPDNSDLRIGLLGYGAIAAEHARALAGIGCSLRVVAGPNAASARTFAETHGFARSSDQVDAVLEHASRSLGAPA